MSRRLAGAGGRVDSPRIAGLGRRHGVNVAIITKGFAQVYMTLVFANLAAALLTYHIAYLFLPFRDSWCPDEGSETSEPFLIAAIGIC